MTRPLTSDERDSAARAFEALPADAADLLLRQLTGALVRSDKVTLLELDVPRVMPAVAYPDGPLPVHVFVAGESDGSIAGEILVWMTAGYLSMLELAWYTDDPPEAWPSLDRLRVS